MAEFARRGGLEVEVATFEAWDPAGREFDAVIAGIREVGGFSEPEQWRFDWECIYTRDEWLDQLPTLGGLTQLPSDQLAKVFEGVGAAIDALGGSFTMPYTTVAVTAARTSAS